MKDSWGGEVLEPILRRYGAPNVYNKLLFWWCTLLQDAQKKDLQKSFSTTGSLKKSHD